MEGGGGPCTFFRSHIHLGTRPNELIPTANLQTRSASTPLSSFFLLAKRKAIRTALRGPLLSSYRLRRSRPRAAADNMMQNPHLYGHHQYTPQDSAAWMHPQAATHQHHAQQAAAAAAAASAAQQQHYSRIASSHNTAGALTAAHAQDGNLETVSEDNRRTMSYIADLLNENTREAALLELSKKREQVPELALILWHSFGTFSPPRASSCLVAPPPAGMPRR